MGDGPSPYLLVIGEREALAWILRSSRMAFPATTRREVDELAVGDRLFLLTTRGCFHNPTRDATRVIGSATVATDVAALPEPVELAGRTFPRGCGITIESVTPYLTGLNLAPLVPELDAFAGTSAWSIRLRRPLVRLTHRDADRVDELLAPLALTPAAAIPVYLDSIRPVAVQKGSSGLRAT